MPEEQLYPLDYYKSVTEGEALKVERASFEVLKPEIERMAGGRDAQTATLVEDIVSLFEEVTKPPFRAGLYSLHSTYIFAGQPYFGDDPRDSLHTPQSLEAVNQILSLLTGNPEISIQTTAQYLKKIQRERPVFFRYHEDRMWPSFSVATRVPLTKISFTFNSLNNELVDLSIGINNPELLPLDRFDPTQSGFSRF